MAENEIPSKKRIEYVPPSDKEIHRFVNLVCDEMARKHDDPSYNTHEIVFGFANFLKVVARIKAKQMTEEANKDLDGQE